MRIARIIRSNSHVDYAARVLDSLETAAPPTSADYRFGQFVRITNGAVPGSEIIGIIYNSQLINPEYGNYGPRLSTPPELNTVFSPDYLNEQGVLIGLLLLGWRTASGEKGQGIPREVLPINAEVETMTADEVRAFHQNDSGQTEIHYYPHILTHAGLFAYQLLSTIITQLESLTTGVERARLSVLRRTLAWQQTMERMR